MVFNLLRISLPCVVKVYCYFYLLPFTPCSKVNACKIFRSFEISFVINADIENAVIYFKLNTILVIKRFMQIFEGEIYYFPLCAKGLIHSGMLVPSRTTFYEAVHCFQMMCFVSLIISCLAWLI